MVRRRWLFALIPALVVLAVGLVTYRSPEPLYNAGVRFIAGQSPTGAADESDEQRLANWQTTEYIVETLAFWVRGGEFAELVADALAADGIDIPAAAIVGTISADNTISVMTLYVTYGDRQGTEDIIRAATNVLRNQNEKALPQLGGEQAALVQLDEPIVNQVPPGLLNQLDLPFRIVLALAAGIGLALLVDYLDPSVRDRSEVEEMGLPVIGDIPPR